MIGAGRGESIPVECSWVIDLLVGSIGLARARPKHVDRVASWATRLLDGEYRFPMGEDLAGGEHGRGESIPVGMRSSLGEEEMALEVDSGGGRWGYLDRDSIFS